MCERESKQVRIKLCKLDRWGRRYAYVDPCIAYLVQAMNDGGLETIASCCGHDGELGITGDIILRDDTWFSIITKDTTMEQIDKIKDEIKVFRAGGGHR